MSPALSGSDPEDGSPQDDIASFADDEFDQRSDAEKLAELRRKGLVPARASPVRALHQLPASAAETEAGTSPSSSVVAFPAPMRDAPAASAHAQPIPARDQTGDDGLARLASDLQSTLEKKRKRARQELAVALKSIEAQEAKCIEPVIDDYLQQIDFQRQKLVMSCGARLAERLEEERALHRDLETFRRQNGLTREPHYPSSAIFSVGVLLALVLVEAGLNGVLFADSSAHGLLGGWTEAVVLATANVGLAFLVGYYALRALNRRGFFSRLCAGLLLAAGLAAIVGLNAFGAHYRDYKAQLAQSLALAKPAPSEPREVVVSLDSRPGKNPPAPVRNGRTLEGRETGRGAAATAAAPVSANGTGSPERAALDRALAAPWDIQSFNGIFLFLIGLCAAALALADGYQLDDPFPGYGRRHRNLVQARRRSKLALDQAIAQATALSKTGFDAVEKAVAAYAREIQALKASHDDYASLRKAWDDKLREEEFNRARSLEHYRLSHKLAGPPFAGGPGWLPDDLSEAQAKTLKSHQKAQVKLQQRVAAEREKLIGLFGGVTGQFQHVFERFGRMKTTEFVGSRDPA